MNNNPTSDSTPADANRIPVKDITPVKVHQPEKKSAASSKNHIYVRQVKGRIENFRQLFGGFFIFLFAAIPWIPYEGQQAILFDIMEQRFHIFGLTLWPQDLTLLAVIFMIGAYALFFITSFAGRVWCGFMCPQTTFTYIYIWFEHKIEGPHNKRMKLDERDMDLDKFLRKFAKHFCWLAVALLTSLTFVGYFTPVSELFVNFFTFQASGLAVLGVLFFTFCTYGNAGWMREIMCTHICPYARFQSVMFDADTLMVAYDEKRGESRGPRSRKMSQEKLKEKGLGDCIDCNMCVQVCPTGIDIRNGLQYECINCGACIDACNGVMDKMNYPKGLINFTSEHALQGKKVHILRPKIIGYAVVLVLMTALLAVQIMIRVPLEVDIIRDRGSLYRETSEGLVENVYTLKILNKHQDEQFYTINVEGMPGAKFIGQQTVTVKGAELETIPVSIAVNPYDIEGRITEINFRVTNEDGSIEVLEPSKFLYR
ncbi:cytochrome c oxidase accessory protein CcoG [Alteromonas sp. a30]|uniref:cytochrome c oxidase accessory protein CcoG n=1 Tax=Alteromonas sp. a30 TaxID=2730917 RepID=UPI0022830446|nr:cytochrome c oxidase accessory protein CcoG [Alteromonas sp. a30]MCY7294711.1 cytochrome c oxidase accessory protein CcoG [Alteromonas sp. a30]